MSPKEKAKELVKKFIEPTKVPNIKGFWVEDIDASKQCALIMVEEILIMSNYTDWWNEVKDEIEKL